MKLARRRVLQWAAGGAAAALVPRGASAQAYPAHPIRLIAGFPAGGQIDIIARLSVVETGVLAAAVNYWAAPGVRDVAERLR